MKETQKYQVQWKLAWNVKKNESLPKLMQAVNSVLPVPFSSICCIMIAYIKLGAAKEYISTRKSRNAHGTIPIAVKLAPPFHDVDCDIIRAGIHDGEDVYVDLKAPSCV